MNARSFRHQQNRVALAMAIGLLVSTIGLGIAFWMEPENGSRPFAERWQTVLQVDLILWIWLAAAIANVARLRFLSPDDIGGSAQGSTTPRVRNAVAILQNTAEQALLAAGAHTALVASFARSDAPIIALVILFSAGRILFWIGYAEGAPARALGFALTFYPSLLCLAIAALSAIVG